MEMRPGGGGYGHNWAYRPVYEDFRPVSERLQEEEAEKLVILLPGFMKENIRVSVDAKNTLRIRGERLVADNKWIRFQEDFQVPEDCNRRGITAKFENGLLTITMPKKFDEPTTQTPLTTPPPPPQTDDLPAKQTLTLPPPLQKDDNIPPKTTNPTIETTTPQQDDNIPPKTTNPTVETTGEITTPQPPQQNMLPPKTTNPTIETPEETTTPQPLQKDDNIPPKKTTPTVETQVEPTPTKPRKSNPFKSLFDQACRKSKVLIFFKKGLFWKTNVLGQASKKK